MVASNSNRVAIGRAPHDDPGSQMDVLPTVMHFLGGAAAIPEGLDGQPFGFRDFTRTKPPQGSCAGANPDTCGCAEVLQSDYRGTVAQTISGATCQRWDSQEPHSHSNTPENNPLSGLDENYCRNPDGEPGGAWCYTEDPDNRWEYCDVPVCTANPEPTANPTPSPTEAPVGNCAGWCEGNGSTWDAKCTWVGCSGCSQCDSPPPEDNGDCKTWCATNQQDWNTKCGWNSCQACEECP